MITTMSLSGIAGNDILLEFAITDLAGVPVAITGATVRFAIARDPTAPVITTEESPQTATVIRTDDPGGIFRIAVAGEQTEDLRGDYRWEVELEDVAGSKASPLFGVYTFKAGLL